MKKIGFIPSMFYDGIHYFTYPCSVYVDGKGYIIGIHESDSKEEMFYLDVDSAFRNGNYDNNKKMCLLTIDGMNSVIAPLHELITKEVLKIVADHLIVVTEEQE